MIRILIVAFSFMSLAGLGMLYAQIPAAPAAQAPMPPQQPVIEDDGVRVSILGYHDFSKTQPETAMRMRTDKFRKQMETLKQLGITVVSLADFKAWKAGEKSIPEKSALITLDDGWKSVYTDAYPILKEFGYPFTLYLYKNYVDGGGKALTTEMIKEMMANGASLGSHSVSHPYPIAVKNQRKKGPEVYEAYLRKEMGESKFFLESKFSGKIETYAYPGGFYTEEMLSIGEEFGYRHMFTVLPGKVKRGMPDLTLPRYMILGNYDRIFEFATQYGAPLSTTLSTSSEADAVVSLPHPVTPEPGAMVNSRLPIITVDLSKAENLDPASLVMQVSGFGNVPAIYQPETKQFSWQVNRPLRQKSCQVLVQWNNLSDKKPATPLRWAFEIDRTSAYLPEGDVPAP